METRKDYYSSFIPPGVDDEILSKIKSIGDIVEIINNTRCRETLNLDAMFILCMVAGTDITKWDQIWSSLKSCEAKDLIIFNLGQKGLRRLKNIATN